MKKAFTLLELLLIVIIIGMLATFAIPQFVKIGEKALDNEAQGYLMTMLAGEKIFKSETDAFYPSTVHVDLNNNLDISLPPAGGKWNYSAKVYPASGTSPGTVCVQAERNSNTTRYWSMYDTDLDGPQTGQCK
ncbi:MAG: hypothetical protein ABSE81_02750 [Candidatus Omnitrophota bacterium]|jgi:type II secretory pathway pseudopilin PulG